MVKNVFLGTGQKWRRGDIQAGVFGHPSRELRVSNCQAIFQGHDETICLKMEKVGEKAIFSRPSDVISGWPFLPFEDCL